MAKSIIQPAELLARLELKHNELLEKIDQLHHQVEQTLEQATVAKSQ